MQPHLLLASAGAEAGRVRTQAESAQSALTRSDDHNRESGDGAVRDELFCPAEDVLVAVTAEPALRVDRVRPGRRLCQRPAPEIFAAGEGREPALLLFDAGGDKQMTDAPGGVRGDGPRDRAVAPAKLLHYHPGPEGLQPG